MRAAWIIIAVSVFATSVLAAPSPRAAKARRPALKAAAKPAHPRRAPKVAPKSKQPARPISTKISKAVGERPKAPCALPVVEAPSKPLSAISAPLETPPPAARAIPLNAKVTVAPKPPPPAPPPDDYSLTPRGLEHPIDDDWKARATMGYSDQPESIPHGEEATMMGRLRPTVMFEHKF